MWTSGSEQRPSEAAPVLARKRLLRRGPAPGVPALLVATRSRRGGALRMHLLAEVGQSARSWPLSDLRLVDGLGLPVREATDFALTFTGAARPLVWRCESAPKRAAFLWSLLQVCAARLQSRAPPSQRISLLELQTFAREVAAKHPDPASAKAVELGLPAPIVPANGTNERAARPLSPPPRAKSPSRVVRTASEPQAGALHRLTVARAFDSRRSADGAPPPAARDLNLHERAFLIEATRLGAGPASRLPIRSRPQSPAPMAMMRVGDDATSPRSATSITVASPVQAAAPALPRRPSGASLRKGIALRDGASPTERLVARCKMQEERRQFRLDAPDAADLAHALRLFDGDASDADPSPLDGFADWTRSRVQAIEATNMADTVQIELDPHRSQIADFRRALVTSVDAAEAWLAPAEARLAPYAALVADIQTRAEMLDRHREHAVGLHDRLQHLLEGALWSEAEEEVAAEVLERMQRDPVALISDDAFISSAVAPVAETLADKLECDPDCSLYDEIAGLATARADMAARRDTLVAMLEPCLVKRAVRLREGSGAPYLACSSSLSLSLVSGASMSPVKMQKGALEQTAAHARLVRVLARHDPESAVRVLAAYQVTAASWTSSAMMQVASASRMELADAPDPAVPVTRFAENVAAIQVQEFGAATALFGPAAEELAESYPGILDGVLRVQFDCVNDTCSGFATELVERDGDCVENRMRQLVGEIFSVFVGIIANGNAALVAKTVRGEQDKNGVAETVDTPAMFRLFTQFQKLPR